MTTPKSFPQRRPQSTRAPQAVDRTTQATVSIQQARLVATRMTGPIPDPTSLGLYGEIDPSFPERLMAAMERQEAHRQTLEKFSLEQYYAQEAARQERSYSIQKRGQIFGLVVSLAAFAVSAMLAVLGHDWVASGIAVTASVSLAVAFITGRVLDRKKSSKDQKSSTE
ncbi:MAG: hypothetical protein HQL91_02325 [Magnetococcales bacterium]|nr:hypothetical protein [Magnetococcales bacterium]